MAHDTAGARRSASQKPGHGPYPRTSLLLVAMLIGSCLLDVGALAKAPLQEDVLTLEQVERLAIENNPTLSQAEAAIQAAQGKRKQAGLFPNPIVGYQGDEFAFRAFTDKSEHFFFIEQTIPLGGKLAKNRRIVDSEIAQTEIEAGAQKQRVLNSVRMLYYEMLGAQELVDLRTELVRIAREATSTTSELLNVGQADRPDFLESEIEGQQAELELINARNNLRRTWQALASVIGAPARQQSRLAGRLEDELPALDQDTVTAALLRESPDLKRAQTAVERARAALERAKAGRVPDLFLRAGAGYSNEFLENRGGATGMRTGPEANVQIGITLPVFNRNQGAIAAAVAELTIAERDVNRIQLALQFRMADVFRDYKIAIETVQRYKNVIIPRAQKAYDLYLASFKQMAASYPQVLISQRTLFQLRSQYLSALVDLRRSAIQIQGFFLSGALDPPRSATGNGPNIDGVRDESTGGKMHE